jgi:hypothetical protein
MTGLLFVAAITAAVIVLASRRWRRGRLRRAARSRPGNSPASAIAIRSYGEMEDHLRGRWCHCGGYLERAGEGTREIDDRRYRVARHRCQECDEEYETFFDATGVLH